MAFFLGIAAGICGTGFFVKKTVDEVHNDRVFKTQLLGSIKPMTEVFSSSVPVGTTCLVEHTPSYHNWFLSLKTLKTVTITEPVVYATDNLVVAGVSKKQIDVGGIVFSNELLDKSFGHRGLTPTMNSWICFTNLSSPFYFGGKGVSVSKHLLETCGMNIALERDTNYSGSLQQLTPSTIYLYGRKSALNNFQYSHAGHRMNVVDRVVSDNSIAAGYLFGAVICAVATIGIGACSAS